MIIDLIVISLIGIALVLFQYA